MKKYTLGILSFVFFCLFVYFTNEAFYWARDFNLKGNVVFLYRFDSKVDPNYRVIFHSDSLNRNFVVKVNPEDYYKNPGSLKVNRVFILIIMVMMILYF